MKILSGDKYLHCFNGNVFSLQDVGHEDISYHIENAETIEDSTCDNKSIRVNCSNALMCEIVLISPRHYDSITKINEFHIIRAIDAISVSPIEYYFETFQIIDGYVCVTHKGVSYKITSQACRANTSYRVSQNFRLTPYAKQDEYALRVEYDDADLDCGLK